MNESLATKQETGVARPLRDLVPLIKEEIELGRAAGLEHYRKAGEMLNEAKAQVAPGEWQSWLKRNFKLSEGTARNYMRLARLTGTAVPVTGTTLSEIVRPYGDTSHHAVWERPVRLAVNKVDVAAMTQERQSRARETKLTRELGLRLIDIGYKALAGKLHPDKGGSTEAMARLNRVRVALKRAL